jgi:hypothetical protein
VGIFPIAEVAHRNLRQSQVQPAPSASGRSAAWSPASRKLPAPASAVSTVMVSTEASLSSGRMIQAVICRAEGTGGGGGALRDLAADLGEVSAQRAEATAVATLAQLLKQHAGTRIGFLLHPAVQVGLERGEHAPPGRRVRTDQLLRSLGAGILADGLDVELQRSADRLERHTSGEQLVHRGMPGPGVAGPPTLRPGRHIVRWRHLRGGRRRRGGRAQAAAMRRDHLATASDRLCIRCHRSATWTASGAPVAAPSA